jgi:riboflavin synthase
MFTGIITHLGKVKEKSSTKLVITADKDLLDKVTMGMSIAVDGICLTAVSYDDTSFAIEYMPETADKTNIQTLAIGSLVNLELPATSETFLAGHIVQGHVDAVGEIMSITNEGNSRLFKIKIAKDIGNYIVEKGSITVNGISLTVIDVTDAYFTVGIIPHTWERTMLHTAKEGDIVNLEVDVLAKYLEKLLAKRK